MFFSLIQTLACVLLIQTGLYALHLSGNSGGTNLGSNMNMGAGNANIPNNHMLHILSGNGQAHSQHHAKSNAGRLAEEIADFAQMERERLMLLDLAKQTAAAVNAASSTSHHGRPIITGRIQMTPAEEIDDVDYPGIMIQQPQRSYMFGSVVKQAPRHGDDYDSAEEFDGGGQFGVRRRPMKYEYGREVQTQDHEYDDPQRMDMDDFMELEVAEPDVDEMIPDLDGYQYLDELLNEQHKDWNDEHLPIGYVHHRYPQNPYLTLEELESKPPQALQELFDKEREHVREQQQKQLLQHERAQHDAPIVGAALSTQTAKGHKELLPQIRNAATGTGYNIRLQQQWQRKRNYLQQQQQQHQRQHEPHLQRNIFGGHQKHHFNSLQNAKVSLANSEATATKHIGLGKNDVANADSSSSDVNAAIKTTPQQSNSNKASVNSKSTAAADASATSQWSPSSSSSSSPSTSSSSSSLVSPPLQSSSSSAAAAAASTTHHNGEAGTMTAKEHSLQSNHKRSGSVSGGSFGSGLQPPQLAHSIASQLMLRTARGQRQYDVPQIECPSAMDGMERFACPTPDLQGRYRCIDDHVLCDGFIDCPEGEDEDRRSCMFYKTTKAHLDVLADALLRWARGR